MSRGDRVRPTAEELAPLGRFERGAVALAEAVNRNALTKGAAQRFLRTVGRGWVALLTRNLIRVVGEERVAGFRPRRGVLLVSNHRTFFDQHVISCWLMQRTHFFERMYFPVRSDYFYERPGGVLVNLAMAGMAMYPPVFRDPQKRPFNRYMLARLAELLREPGTVVGMHPEGRRSRSDDPYQLQPAQPGVGKLILAARPEVLPVFLGGLTNDPWAQIRGNFGRSGRPIIMVVGAPLDLSDFYERPNRLRLQRDLAEHVVSQIRALGTIEREIRAAG